MRSRRTFLKRAGVVGTAGLLAGCTQNGGNGSDGSGSGSGSPTSDEGSSGSSGGSGDNETTTQGMDFGNGELNFTMSPSEPQDLMMQQYQPVKSYLSEELPVPAQLRYASAYSAVIRALGSGTGDVAETGPFAAALGVASEQAEIALQRFAFGTWTYSSVIVTRQDSDIQELSDLEGKTVYFADPLSASGSLYPLNALKEAGLSIGNMPNNDQGADFEGQYAGGHESAFRGMMSGQADAAGVGRFITLTENDEGERVYKDGIREVHREREIPRAPIVVSPELSDAEQEAVVSAFTDAPESMYLGADGEEGTDDDLWFGDVRPADLETYQPVIDVAENLDLSTDLFDELSG